MLEGCTALITQAGVKSTVLSKGKKLIVFGSHLSLCSDFLPHLTAAHPSRFTQGRDLGSAALASLMSCVFGAHWYKLARAHH